MTQLEQRYAPGRRENSFFEDMPVIKKEKRQSSSSDEHLFEYTYYIDSDGKLIKEKLV